MRQFGNVPSKRKTESHPHARIFTDPKRALQTSNPSFPLHDCKNDEIDLLYVADISDYENSLHDHQIQMTFFKDFLDVFLSPEEKTLHRLKVALMTATPSGFVNHVFFHDFNNTEQLKNEIGGLKFYPNSSLSFTDERWTLLEKTNAVRVNFSSTYGSRENVTKVVIMIVGHSPSTSIDEVGKAQNQAYGDVKLFIITIGFKTDPAKFGYRHIKNTLHIASFADLLDNQLLTMAVCNQCKAGWIRLENPHDQHGLSCYNILSTKMFTDWIEGSKRCEKIGAQMASLESKKEINFWNRYLTRYISAYALLFEFNPFFVSVRHPVYIGLLREDRGTLAHRFRWISGNILLHSHWLPDEPNGGSTQACSVWEFLIRFQRSNSSDSRSREPHVSVEGWRDIGCGIGESSIVLCEVTLPAEVSNEKDYLKIVSAQADAVEQALNRGEFSLLSGTIVSIPANVMTHSFPEEQAAIPLFSCGADLGENRFIPYSFVCDHIQHCSNGQDESICRYRECDQVSEFKCHSSQCVPIESRCDHYKDCLDNSDEDECTECKGVRCCDGACFPEHLFMDGEIDCTGCETVSDLTARNDEYNFFLWDREVDEHCAFICNWTECVFPHQLGDGTIDCKGPEGPLDETIGGLEKVDSCNTNIRDSFMLARYRNKTMWGPRCIYIEDRYQGVLGCRDMVHLQECENFKCPEGYTKCPNSYCIPLNYLHDGKNDCPMGEDENFINGNSCKGNFACSGSYICLHPDLVCDRHPHCPLGDDELNCGISCAAGFQCTGGTVTVAEYVKATPLRSLAFIDSRTRFLDLSGIDLSITFDKEERGRLFNIIDIRLSNCKIADDSASFVINVQSLETVRWMDLSNNLIRRITMKSMFRYMNNLRHLDLSSNRLLISIEERGFHPISGRSFLERLDLSNTGLEFLFRTSLQDLISLKYLNLSNTNIANLHDTFPDDLVLRVLDVRNTLIEEVNSESLKGLTIQDQMHTDNYRLCCPQVRGSDIPQHSCLAPVNAISSCEDLVRKDSQRSLLWLVGSVAVIGNAGVIILRIVTDRNVVKKTYALFVTNLGISDLMMGVYLLIIGGTDVNLRGRYVWSETLWRHSDLCHVAGFLSTLSSETSTIFAFLITLERFLVIKFPFGEFRFSRWGSRLAVLVAWSTGFVLAVIPVLPPFRSWVIYSSNGMCLGLPLDSGREKGWEYSVAVFIVFNFVMFLCIACGQFAVYRAMSEGRKITSESQVNARRAQDITVAKHLSLVVLSNFLCWFPIGLMGLIALTGNDIGNDAYAWSTVLVLPVNSALNPLLYTLPVIKAKWQKFKNGHLKDSNAVNASSGKGRTSSIGHSSHLYSDTI